MPYAIDVSLSSIFLNFGRICVGGAVRSRVNSLIILAACSLIAHFFSAFVDAGVVDNLMCPRGFTVAEELSDGVW